MRRHLCSLPAMHYMGGLSVTMHIILAFFFPFFLLNCMIDRFVDIHFLASKGSGLDYHLCCYLFVLLFNFTVLVFCTVQCRARVT